jgi:hypothetical protein
MDVAFAGQPQGRSLWGAVATAESVQTFQLAAGTSIRLTPTPAKRTRGPHHLGAHPWGACTGPIRGTAPAPARIWAPAP